MPSLLLAVFSALLLSLSRLPLHLGWLVFVAWIPLLVSLERKDFKPVKAALSFSIIQIGIVFYWIAEVTPGGLVGIVILYFLYYLLSFYFVKRIWDALPKYRYLGFVAILLSFEYLQNYGEMRFPWFNQAYSLADYSILIQAADIGGVILLSFLIMVINVLVYRSIKGKLRSLIGIAIVAVVWLGYGLFCYKSIELTRHDAGISVMQPAIPQDVKWDQEFYNFIMKRYDEMCMQAAKDSTHLFIFPEAAIPDYLMYEPGSMQAVQSFASKYNMDIFTGFPHYTAAPPEHVNPVYYYNAASLFKPDGSIAPLYYKNILVPVGERMLWLDKLPFLWKLQFGQANWEFGTELCWMKSGDYSFSPSICYEIAFADIHRDMAIPKDPQSGRYKKTDYLVNITNDAWFGTSYGPWLHAVMTRFRAIENRIQIYRSANTGISMIVDPMGRVISKAGLMKQGIISAPLSVSAKIPLYRRIAWYPVAIVVLAIGLSVVSLLIRKRRWKQ